MNDNKLKIVIDSDLEELIPGFLENRQKDLRLLREALAAGNIETVQSIGHSIKGVGGGYGFDGLSELGAELEMQAKSGRPEGLDVIIDNIQDYLDRVVITYE